MRFLKRLIKCENGQALAAVLICLLFGGVIVAGSVRYVDTIMRGRLAIKTGNLGIYAAEAGVENSIWYLKNNLTPVSSLPQNINGMQVTMQNVSKGTYTIYAGQLIPATADSTDLHVSSEMIWDAGANAYRYTITCTWTSSGNCKLREVGVRLPIGYNYQAGSAASFSGNLSLSEPTNQVDDQGAHSLKWTLPNINITTRTQIFYVTGSGEIEGNYAWAIATRMDIYYSSELTGVFYVITATATKSGKVAARIEANLMKSGSNMTVISWRINPT